MLLRKYPDRGRRAFTLLEMIIVIAIIAMLVALLLGAVVSVMNARDRAQVQFETQKMTESLKTAMNAFPGKPQFLPSQLLLYNTLSNYASDNSALSKQSRTALTAIFGPRLFKNGNTVNWDNSGNPNAKNILSGDQCLVFYLGGITSTSGGATACLGFSTNPTDPSSSTGTVRLGPFFDFKSNRLTQLQSGSGNPFFSYLDPYGTQPYAHFSTFGSSNNYSTTDCSSLSVQPYTIAGTSPAKFFNADSFQIICAGKDGVFGNTGSWDPAGGTTDQNTKDDLTNFARSMLGSGQ